MPRLSGSGMAWPVRESEAELVGVPPAAPFWAAMENEGDGGGLIAPVGVVGFLGQEIVEPFQGTKQFGAGTEVGRLA